MSLGSFFKAVEQDIIGGAKKATAVANVALSDAQEFVGFALGAGQAIITAADPALAPVVTPIVTSLESLLAESKTAIDAAGSDVEAQAAAAAPYITNLMSTGVQLINAAGPGVHLLANVVTAAKSNSAAPPTSGAAAAA